MPAIPLLLLSALAGPVAIPPTPPAIDFPRGGVLPSVQRTGTEPGQHIPAARGTFGWPLNGPPPVTRHFHPPPHPYGPGHRGVDLAGVTGQTVLAAGDGVVVVAEKIVDRGVISIAHPNGLRTTYEPVTPLVTHGQWVQRGDVIGSLDAGHAGCPAEACLHWGVRRGRDYVDPLRLVTSHPVRLLPWRGS
ncbi:hypothetical protein GCM10012275_08260 [Longimycelium tulufanense]|uniref:M23ase beta-sheet core domain-containing protein n=1 Tax=Longimycelium tulufanense TaxID=907463 RepID=A0A8J3C9J7_9PSEU|nr:M23 family metallopeptidase [Longimycelium tulufanense]GGM39735.1 hypothetical protein GCM10012275_08260 [Longimycelium tulufanense]